MSSRYDVVVVGAGIAGSYLAYLLSRLGIDVLLVDMKPFERVGDKPCGDAIGKHHFDELGVEYPKGNELEGIVRGIDVYSPYEDVKYRVLGYGFEVNRIAFTQRFVRKAVDNGVTYLEKTHALRPIISRGKVVGVTLWRRGQGSWNVNSSLLVDATGLSRAIVRHLPSEWPVSEKLDAKDINIAYREVRVLRKPIEEPEILRIYINKNVAPGGYWWLFPYSLSDNVVNVGLGVQGGMGYPNPKDLLYEHVLKREVFEGSKVVEAGGAPLPTRRALASLVWHGIAAAGDAAFTANPIHGGGKGSAMISSYCLAKAIERALKTGELTLENLWSANICYNERYGVKQAVLDLFRRFLQRLSNEDLEYGMKRRLIREEDLNVLSLKGDLELSVVEKAMRLLAGLGRPSLLLRLRSVAKFMDRIKSYYRSYPEKPEMIYEWIRGLNRIYEEFEEKALK